jgi:hypothetical protein
VVAVAATMAVVTAKEVVVDPRMLRFYRALLLIHKVVV